MKTENAITAKKKEIEKRREVITTSLNSQTENLKRERKEQKIDMKAEFKTKSIDSTIGYYRNQLDDARARLDKEMLAANNRLEQARLRHQKETEEAEAKFNRYQEYCQEMIKKEEEKRDTILSSFEKQKELVVETVTHDEEADKVLVRLKVELEQLENSYKEDYALWEQETRKEQLQRKKQQDEFVRMEQEKYEHAQWMENERLKQEALARKSKEDQEERERKERRKLQEAKEEAEKAKKQEEKEILKSQRQKFMKEYYPNLSPEATGIYTKLKDIEAGFPNALYKDAHEQETLKDCEEFLLSFADDMKELIAFEDGPFRRWTIVEKDIYETLGLYDRLKAMKIKDKTKRRDFLAKFDKQETAVEE